jgi:endonuclease YncB( thermonuclease family)
MIVPYASVRLGGRRLIPLVIGGLLWASPVGAQDVYVIDGDTVIAEHGRLRFMRCDAPEIYRPKCPKERELGLKSAVRLMELVAAAKVKRPDYVRRERAYRKWGRRWVGILRLDGEDVCATLMREGLARLWDGKRRSWCPTPPPQNVP